MWDTLIVNPMINALLFFYDLLGNNFILAIAVFTILIRLITLPLNMRQQRSMIGLRPKAESWECRRLHRAS